MKTIKDLYSILEKEYVVKWNNKVEYNDFSLYFSNASKHYRIEINIDLVILYKINNLNIFNFDFKNEIQITHTHFDYESQSIDDIYVQITKYIEKYTKH